jgi:hypothetical protein
MKNAKKLNTTGGNNSTIKTLPYDNKMSKKEVFESVYTAILSKVNNNLGNKTGNGFQMEQLEANECTPESVETDRGQNNPVLGRSGITKEIKAPVKFHLEELQQNNSAPEEITNNKTVDPKQEAKEGEIQRKVNDYNKKLVSEQLLKVLTEERQKEEEREQLYMKTKDPLEKKRLEKILAFERAQSSERINKINEDISEQLKAYENKLRISK